MVILYSILLNLALVIFGYLIGSINTSIIMSNKFKKDDVREHYSKNAGATNSLRVYGKKFALIVFLIDVLKTLIPTLILATIFKLAIPTFSSHYFMSPQAYALGVVIGHIFPVFYKFKGGKGVACSVGFIASINVICFVIAAILFFSIAITKKIVSLASILTAAIMVPIVWIPWMEQGILGYFANNLLRSDIITPSFLMPYWYVTPILFTLAIILVISMHHTNIKRLIQKTEKQLTIKK